MFTDEEPEAERLNDLPKGTRTRFRAAATQEVSELLGLDKNVSLCHWSYASYLDSLFFKDFCFLE